MLTKLQNLNNLQIKYLVDRGVSPNVISLLRHLPEILVDKLCKGVKVLNSHRAVFLTGPESQQKELFATMLLIHIALDSRKSVALCQALTLCKLDKEEMVAPAYATVWAVLGLGMVQSGFASQRVKEFLMNVLQTPGGFLILGIESLSVIEGIYGQSFADYFKSISFGVTIDLEKFNYLTL